MISSTREAFCTTPVALDSRVCVSRAIPRICGTVPAPKMRQVLGEIISADTALATYAYIYPFFGGTKKGGVCVCAAAALFLWPFLFSVLYFVPYFVRFGFLLLFFFFLHFAVAAVDSRYLLLLLKLLCILAPGVLLSSVPPRPLSSHPMARSALSWYLFCCCCCW